MKRLILLLLSLALLHAKNLEQLLQKYEAASDLSKITKKEASGFVYVYSREELEQMQAYTLEDVLKSIIGINYTYTPNYVNLFSYASISYIPITAVRLYINDHDLSSSSFGSALLIWGELPLEYIDHIEVYKGSSSVEFGEETGVIVIKVYTKLPTREVGNKIHLQTDHRGSIAGDFYTAQILDNDSTLFGYIHASNYNAKRYYNDGYPLSRDKKDALFYLNYSRKSWNIEASSYFLDKDPFLGNGRRYHPTGGGLDARHTYLKIDKRFGTTTLTLAYDNLTYDRSYKDPTGVYTAHGYVRDYNIEFNDEIWTLDLKKDIDIADHALFVGAFYKYKGFRSTGRFDAQHSYAKNGFGLSSLFVEDTYSLGPSTSLFFAIKGDYYRFDKAVTDKKALILRGGFIKKWPRFEFKAFATKFYMPAQFYALYAPGDLPLKANPKLKFPQGQLYNLRVKYSDGPLSVAFKFGHGISKDKIIYAGPRGFVNKPEKAYFSFVESNILYRFDPFNKIYFDILKATNSKEELSPSFQANLRIFNRFERIALYNELLYKKGYSYFGHKVDASLDATVALKYFYTKDLHIGVRAENLLNKGFRQAYRKTSASFPVTDHRFILNLEYTF